MDYLKEFGPILCKYYDSLFDFPDQQMVRALLQKTRGPLVDLGCGPGRTLQIAVDLNIPSIGVDSSSNVLKACRERFLKGKANPQYIQSELAKLAVKDITDAGLITCLGNTLPMFLKAEDRNALIKKIYQALKPGGAFLLIIKNDNPIPPTELKRSREQNINGKKLTLGLTINEDHSSGIRNYQFEVKLDEEIEKYSFNTFLISAEELTTQLKTAGFKKIQLWGSYDQSAYSKDSPYQIFECFK